MDGFDEVTVEEDFDATHVDVASGFRCTCSCRVTASLCIREGGRCISLAERYQRGLPRGIMGVLGVRSERCCVWSSLVRMQMQMCMFVV